MVRSVKAASKVLSAAHGDVGARLPPTGMQRIMLLGSESPEIRSEAFEVIILLQRILEKNLEYLWLNPGHILTGGM